MAHSVAPQLERVELQQRRTQADTLLVAEDITKRFPSRPKPILEGANLELPRGALVGLQGANGAGKTTLLRVVAGLFTPDSGRVTLDGLDPIRDRRAYQRRLGFLPAGQGGLYARLSVKMHLDYWARLALLPRESRRHAVIMALARFELAEMSSSRVDRLSTGQRQRIRLAMAFLHDPDVILLDEPGNSLDEAGLSLLRSAIDDARRADKCVVWCAPTLGHVDMSFDREHELVDGKVIAL